jgi:tRNA-Thr(GGU) m(6)t(6)A37 methyltransferase TsaA
MSNGPSQGQTYQMQPIGTVHSSDDGNYVEIFEPFRPGLKQLDQFSHVIVVWWADQHDNAESRGMMQTRPPYASDKLTGVFACRAEYRPNPIAITTTRILAVDEEQGTIQVTYMDAYDGTPVVDLKAYFPVCDRVKEAHIPEWLSEWPEWLPEGEDFSVED